MEATLSKQWEMRSRLASVCKPAAACNCNCCLSTPANSVLLAFDKKVGLEAFNLFRDFCSTQWVLDFGGISSAVTADVLDVEIFPGGGSGRMGGRLWIPPSSSHPPIKIIGRFFIPARRLTCDNLSKLWWLARKAIHNCMIDSTRKVLM